MHEEGGIHEHEAAPLLQPDRVSIDASEPANGKLQITSRHFSLRGRVSLHLRGMSSRPHRRLRGDLIVPFLYYP